MSRHILTLSRQIKTLHGDDQVLSRHTETCLATLRHFRSTSKHDIQTSRYCLDILMMALENGLERKKIVLHNSLERYVSVYN